MPRREPFHKRLVRLRQAAGLSQARLAAAAGVPFGTLRNWEYGRREPLASAVAPLAVALGVTADVLLGLTPDAPAVVAEEESAEPSLRKAEAPLAAAEAKGKRKGKK